MVGRYFNAEIRSWHELAFFVARFSATATAAALFLTVVFGTIHWTGRDIFWFSVAQTLIIAPTVAVPMIYLFGRTGWQQADARDRLLTTTVTDPLTGLRNRRGFMDAVAEMGRAGMAIALVDIDHFKSVNDRYGHAAGDAVIREVGRLLAGHAGRDLVARVGGEEFVLLSRDEREDRLLLRMERFRADVARTATDFAGRPIACTVSVGVATARGREFDPLFCAADVALYAAKRRGRDRVVAESDLTSGAAIDDLAWAEDAMPSPLAGAA